MYEENKDVDLSSVNRGVWLVKVPKYVAQKWEQAPSDMEVAKLRMLKSRGNDPKMLITLTPQLLALEPQNVIASEIELNVSAMSQTLAIFSSKEDAEQKDTASEPMEQHLAMEGWVTHKFDCRPVCNDAYIKMKQHAMHQANEPKRTIQPIDYLVHNYKPVNDHAHNIEYLRRKKAAGPNCRASKEAVMDMVFAAFENHQYYTFKDLQFLTKQPVDSLKKVLREIGEYRMSMPHKYMWELKREYRHYQNKEPSGSEAE